jgi:molybdenum cofactor synthesis domain-containing protein
VSSLRAKVLTVSDGVVAGTREDRSGAALAELLSTNGFEVVERRVCADGADNVEQALRSLLSDFAGLIVTTGGTGFGPRDLTPEGSERVIERSAPGMAEAMRGVSPLGRLSRGKAGAVGACLILNTPGSPGGAVECVSAVLDVLPHALGLLGGEADPHPPSS